jgi:amidase
VKALRDAGAVFYVKTTCPQTGMALETVSNLWGRTVNPYNNLLGSGGSSGGDGALVAMRGALLGPSTDIGGSIRCPGAFNGLYSIRPSADRIPKGGMRTTVSGQNSIKVSAGPVCHSMADLKAFTKVINGHPLAEYDATFTPMPWREVEAPRKLTVGIWEFDGVCMPHPYILRAIRESVAKLKAAGHEGKDTSLLIRDTTKMKGLVIPLKLPIDCWEAAVTTWKLYFQTGAAELKATIAKGREEMIPALKRHMEIFDIKELSTPELFALNTKQGGYKAQMARFWAATAATNASGQPLDAIICPVHPSASYP